MARKSVMGRGLGSLIGASARERASKPDAAEAADDAVQALRRSAATHAGARAEALAAAPGAAGSDPDDASPSDADPEAGPEARSEPRRSPELRSVPGVGAAASAADAAAPEADDATARPGDRLRTLGIDQIRRGEFQPRRHFDPALLQELADSLDAQGLIQPILVRARDDGFELIAGERRWRAAQLAGMHEIPAIVRELDDRDVASVALIENIQRKDLNPLEEAAAFRRLCDDFGMTHQDVATSVGRSRVSVSNMMRLLELHADVRERIDRGELEMGNARALLGLPPERQPELAARIVEQGLTTRAVEKLVRELRDGKPAPAPKSIDDPDIERLAERLGGVLGAPVNIKHRPNGGGRLEIGYGSVDELEGILAHIS